MTGRVAVSSPSGASPAVSSPADGAAAGPVGTADAAAGAHRPGAGGEQ
ncbi:MAG TPA: hypothetical protein VF838_04665 [Trebonia sp.]